MKGLNIELADLPLTEFTISYLVHLWLQSQVLIMKKQFAKSCTYKEEEVEKEPKVTRQQLLP